MVKFFFFLFVFIFICVIIFFLYLQPTGYPWAVAFDLGLEHYAYHNISIRRLLNGHCLMTLPWVILLYVWTMCGRHNKCTKNSCFNARLCVVYCNSWMMMSYGLWYMCLDFSWIGALGSGAWFQLQQSPFQRPNLIKSRNSNQICKLADSLGIFSR
jgi:hypothetical protein